MGFLCPEPAHCQPDKRNRPRPAETLGRSRLVSRAESVSQQGNQRPLSVQASALAFSVSNSLWSMAPESRSALALAIWSADEAGAAATCLM